MTDDTIDSEVVDILESLGNKILSHSDKMVWSVNRKREADVNAIEETEQIIKQLIAQEANKARLDELTRVWGGLHTAGTIRDNGYLARNLNLDDLSYWLHNRRRVLKGEKALTPEEWLEAER